MPTRPPDEENIHSNLRSEPRVRWKGTPGSTAAVSASAAASTPNRQTPSKRAKSKFGGDVDAVAAYHFAGVPNTPWSKKKRHRGHGNRGELGKSRGDREDGRGGEGREHGRGGKQPSVGDEEVDIADAPLENTFNLGGTASLASVYGDLNASTLSGLSHPDGGTSDGDHRLNLSLSERSTSSRSLNDSGISSGMSVESEMNRTTLSDTHELSTSNFILSNRVRGVIGERARQLGLEEAKEEWMRLKRGGEVVGEVVGKGGMTADFVVGKTMQTEFGEGATDSRQDEGIMECTSHQRSTPKKKELAMLDESTTSSLGLNELLGNLDDSVEESAVECEVSDAKTGDLSLGFGSFNSDTANSNEVRQSDAGQRSFAESTASQNYLDGVLNGCGDEEKSADMECVQENDKESDDSLGQGSPQSGKGNSQEQSFMESTASQNYLDGVLNGADCENTGNISVAARAKECIASTKQSPAVQANTPRSNQITSNLRQSPSFLSGKKKSMPWRKSTGGDELAKMRALTASLKKKNRDKFGRMSLPAQKNAVSVQVSAKETGPGEEVAKDSARALFSEAKVQDQIDSPARNTRSSKRDTAFPDKSPSKCSTSTTTKGTELINFTSHQRQTPGKQKEASMLDNSSTESSLGLNDLFANLDDCAEKANMDREEGETGNLSLDFGSPSKSVQNKAPAATKPSPKKPFKSPSKEQFDSPARNMRRSKKDSSSPTDSPARNARSGGKSPSKSTSKSVDYTRSSPKCSPAKSSSPKCSPAKSSSPKCSPAKSPSRFVDSPARNTRSAKKSVSSPAKSPLESTPARKSLFTSAFSPSAFNQLDSPAKRAASAAPMDVTGRGPFSGRKRTNFSPSSESREPLTKRATFCLSPPSDGLSLSLSKEYPFLDVSVAHEDEESLENKMSSVDKPASKDLSAIENSPEPTATGTNTLMFNNLMNDIKGMAEESYISEDSNNADISSGLSSFGDDMSISSAKQFRNKRRETANFTDLMGILADGSKEATSSEMEQESVTPPPAKLQTPREGGLKTPKSIFNSNKGKRSAKNVMFGSPETAEYNIGSPSASFTPKQPKVARNKFTSESDEVEQTTELEGDITQMIAKASDPSLMGPIDESRIEAADFPSDASSIGFSSLSSSKGSCQFVGGERTEELETNIYSLVGASQEGALNSSEESEFSLPSVSEDSEGTPSDVKLAGPSISGMSSMDIEETAQLEGNLSALVRGNSDVPADATQTIAIEGTMASLLDAASNSNDFSDGVSKNDSQTMEIEGTMAALLDAVGNDSSELQKDDSQTMEIEENMPALLDAVGNDSVLCKGDSQTMEIEENMEALLNAATNDSSTLPNDDTQAMAIDRTVASLLENVEANKGYQDMSFKQSRQSLPASKPIGSQESNWTYSTLSIPLDSNLEELVDGESKSAQTQHAVKQTASQSFEAKTGTEMPENTGTMSLDANLEQLLAANTSSTSSQKDTVQFSKGHVSGDDDTVSELGMGTSHELSNSDMQSSLGKIVEDEPLEPVDLEIGELLEHRGNQVNLDSHDDVMLNALKVTSKNAFSPVKRETVDILSQVCTDIESQISTIDVESEFSSIVERKEDMFRALQHKLRANDETSSTQLSTFLQAANASILSEWDSWVNQVAGLYNDQLHDTAVGDLEKVSLSIANKTSEINYQREQVALPKLLQYAKRATKRNYQRQQAKKSQLDDEVGQLEAELKKAEIELRKLQQKSEKISGIAESNQESDVLSNDTKTNRRRADSAFYKFFNLEKLHNWIITSSNDSYINMVSNGPSSETHLHLSFWITKSSNTAFECKIGPLTRAVNSLVDEKQVRYHPSVTGFLKSKMSLLCQDLKENTRIDGASKISNLIISIEHKVARIQQAAMEFDALLSQCKNSFLQPSDTLKDGFDFYAYITSASRPGARIQVTLTLSDSYPFAPIGVRLHSTDSSLDMQSMTRKLKKAIKPGFGALTKAIDALNGLLD